MSAQQPGVQHHLTDRAAVAITVAVGMGLAAVRTGNVWFLLLCGAAAGVLVVGLCSRPKTDGLTIAVGHAPRVRLGEYLPVRITVTNTGDRATSEARVCLHTKGLANVVVSVPRLDPGGSTSLAVERLAGRRAVAQDTRAHVVSRPSLGLMAGLRELQVADHLIVHPALHHVGRVVPAGAVGEETDGLRPGGGPEVLGVREWRNGDDTGRLHWRSTARTGRPTVLMRGVVETPGLRVVLVGADTTTGFEEALAAAASVCDAVLRSGAAVAAVAWHVDGPVLADAASRGQLLDWWSSVHDTVLPDAADFGRTLAAGFGGGDVVVAGPPEMDGTWLRAAALACPGMLLLPLVRAA